jgi:hypothetical protein
MAKADVATRGAREHYQMAYRLEVVQLEASLRKKRQRIRLLRQRNNRVNPSYSKLGAC